MSMKERLARAFCQEVSKGTHLLSFATDWDNAKDWQKADLLRCIDAILQALREPSPEMLSALNRMALCTGYIEEGWRAAIDIALGEVTNG